MKVEERFLKYVSYWTASEDGKDVIPSTKRQFSLADELAKELQELGLEKVKRDEHCYVYGLLPATEGMENKKSMGFIAHMDTAPAFSGKDVKPQVISNYNGGDVALPGNGDVIKVSDFPHLTSLKGRTLITTDGTTLLGADDKAGIADILTAVEEVIAEKIPHGDIWIGFTPDEEVGAGADLFDLDYFQADYAYTVDGDYEGEVAYENFNAASAHFTIKGVNVHPGSAKNVMVNSASIACEIQGMLPSQEVPEHTEDREGFYHLEEIQGDVNEAHLEYIVRDHDSKIFEERQQNLREIEKKINEKYGAGTVVLSLKESYRNMLEVVEKNFFVVEKAKEAIAAAGMEPVSRPVRGGTDGSRLSFMGLPCPNLGTGGYAFHGPKEHITVEGMEAVVKIVKEIIKHPVDR
ncbi:MAG: peptidase T [Lachnospiraceae bacterium]|nr:peptidase T [Lachnospiraceae bacterium]